MEDMSGHSSQSSQAQGVRSKDSLESISVGVFSSARSTGETDNDRDHISQQVVEVDRNAELSDTLTSMANLALTYSKQGRWKEAEELFVQVMEISKTVFGAEHPSTLTSMANLAFTWRSLGRTGDALSLIKTSFQLRK